MVSGINAGMRTVLVKTGEVGQDGKYDAIPTAVKENLLEAADYILKSK